MSVGSHVRRTQLLFYGTPPPDAPVTVLAVVVVGHPGRRGVPNQAFVSRSSFEDVAVVAVATPGPVVVTQPRPTRAGSVTIGRATLEDPPVLTTPAPVVVSRPARPQPVPPVMISRSSLEDVAAPPLDERVPRPVVVTQPTPRPTARVIQSRSSFEDFTTPRPLVVVPRTKRALLAPPIILRSPPPVGGAPAPVVVTRTTQPRVVPPTISRSSFEDAPVVVGEVTPSPVIVTTRTRPAGAVAILLRAPVELCEVPRPDSGITARPSTGITAFASATTTRPNTGTTTRPDTGETEEPC